ncbi:hypothetical protein KM043_011438 [Ampulex compressa]|nr:hypothetical protein KM043_011438 [Ampulex compressa]
MQEKDIVKGKPTLVRRVSNMLKDGNYSGPPMLFRHTSMQKIVHCCQNLNLFPYLLYSFGNSKSHPIARKVHSCLIQLVESVIARLFFLCTNLRHTVIRGIHVDEPAEQEIDQTIAFGKPTSDFRRIQRQKRKQHPFLLMAAVYLAPFILAFQLVGLCSVMIFGKYTPGFIFLTAALMFLGFIAMKVLYHDTVAYRMRYAWKNA